VEPLRARGSQNGLPYMALSHTTGVLEVTMVDTLKLVTYDPTL
jgi:hypothetical protein